MGHEILDDILDRAPSSMGDLERMPIELILIVLGAYFAIGLGALYFFTGLIFSPGPLMIFQFGIQILGGVGLLYVYAKMPHEGAHYPAISMALSVLMLVLGGPVGTLAGLIALIGSVFLLFTSN